MDDLTANKQRPQIRFLRGNEVVLSPDGDVKQSILHFRENKSPGLRSAIGIFSGESPPDAAELQAAADQANTKQGLLQAQRRIRELAHTSHMTIQALANHDDIWGGIGFHIKGDGRKAIAESRLNYRHYIEVSETILKRLAATTSKFLQIAEELKLFDPKASRSGSLVEANDFKRDREIFERQPVLTDELARYLAYADVPILISNDIAKAIGGTEDSAYMFSEKQGIALNHEILVQSANPLSAGNYDSVRTIARALIGMAAITVSPQVITQKLVTGGRWKRLSNEFNTHCASIMTEEQQRVDAGIPGDYAVQDILSQIHFALHSGFYNPQRVRTDLPKCCAFYDEFMGMVKRRADALEKDPIVEPIRLPEKEKSISPIPLPTVETAPKKEIKETEHAPALLAVAGEYYVFPETQGARRPFEALSRKPIIETGNLFLTVECVRHAQQTGTYKLMTYQDMASSPRVANTAWDLGQIIESFGFGNHPETLDEFRKGLVRTRRAIHDHGIEFKLRDGTALDIDRYLSEIESDAPRWFSAIEQQLKDQAEAIGAFTETPTGLNAREVLQREKKTPTLERFHRLYDLKIDSETQALIAKAGIRFVVDHFHETKDEISTRYDQNAIYFHPEFLNKPMAMEMLRFLAVDIAVKHAPIDKSLVALAHKEINEKWDTIPSRWKLPYVAQHNMIVNAALVQAMKEPELFRTKLPIAYLAMHRVESERQAALITLKGEKNRRYEASDTAFSINPYASSPEQQAYFAQLNRIISDLDVSPEQFDRQFRSCVVQNRACILEDAESIISKMTQTHIVSDYAGIPDRRSSVKVVDQSYPNQSTKSLEISSITEDWLTGRFLLALPDSPLPHEKKLFEISRAALQNTDKNYPIVREIGLSSSTNILQSYAAGERLMPLLKRQPEFVAIPNSTKAICIPGAHEKFDAAIHNSVHYICEKKGISGERKAAILAELQTLEVLGKQAFLWPDELAKITSEQQAATLQQQMAAEAAAREEAARALRAAAQAALPVPYSLPESIQGIRTPYGRISHMAAGEWKYIKNSYAQEEKRQKVIRARHLFEQIEPLRAELNTKLPFHQELGDMLFADSVLRRAEYACSSDQEKAKLPLHASAEHAGLALINFLEQPLEGMTPPSREQYERIRAHIFQAPVLLIAALGSDQQLRQLRSLNQELLLDQSLPETRKAELIDRRHKMAGDLLKECGIKVPSDQPFIESRTPVDEVSTEAESSGVDEQLPTVITSLLAAENDVPQTLVPTEEQDATPADPTVRVAAMQEARQRLFDDMMGTVLEAQDGEFPFFECSVDVNKSKLPIALTFTRADGTSVKSILTSHYDCFREKGLLPTLGDTVDLKMAVQSAIFNTHGTPFSAPPSLRRGGGVVDVGLDAPLPPDVYDLEKHRGDDPTNPAVRQGKGGYSVVIQVENPYNRRKGSAEYLDISIPLGIAKNDPASTDHKEIAQEIEIRKLKVLEILDDLGKTSAARSQGGSKRDVVYKLRSWIEEQGKVWGKADNIVLDGFERPLILAQSSEEKGQKITLAPVHLRQDIGGENPSWRMHLQFYIGDKGKRPMGEIVRTRTVNLHTRDRELAVARSLESLRGVDSTKTPGEKRVVGFLHHLQDHMTAHPDAEWTVINKDTPQEEVMIGQDRTLQEFLDDMMRYEHDAGLRIHTGDAVNGRIPVTFTAVRSLTGDYAGTLPPTPETLYLKDRKGNVTPAEVSFTIPEKKRHLIERFARDTQDELRWFTAERYSPVAVASDDDRAKFIDGYIQLPSMEDARKKPQEYRTATIRAALGQAVEKNYEATFGQAWPSTGKPWIETVEEKPRRGRPPKTGGSWAETATVDKNRKTAGVA